MLTLAHLPSGVYYEEGSRKKPWRVRTAFNGTIRHIGFYADEVEAAHAYDAAAREVLGPDAPTNFDLDGKPSVSRSRMRSSSSSASGSGDSCTNGGCVLMVIWFVAGRCQGHSQTPIYSP